MRSLSLFAALFFALVAVVLLLLANGFFVATEFALVSVRRSRIQQHALEGDSRASGILNRLDHLDISIAATQVGITACTLALGLVGTPVLQGVLQSQGANSNVPDAGLHEPERSCPNLGCDFCTCRRTLDACVPDSAGIHSPIELARANSL